MFCDLDETQTEAWVLARWHTGYQVHLRFVPEKDGRPAAKGFETQDYNKAFCWRSYHAARKFQRAHGRFAGYVIINLMDVFRLSQVADEHENRWLNREIP